MDNKNSYYDSNSTKFMQKYFKDQVCSTGVKRALAPDEFWILP